VGLPGDRRNVLEVGVVVEDGRSVVLGSGGGEEIHDAGGSVLSPLRHANLNLAGTFGDAMTFKLGPDDLERARGLTGVEPFEPMRGRPMKEWVLVPLVHARRWSDLAERAFTYLS